MDIEKKTLFKKLTKQVKRLGNELIYQLLLTYYVLQKPGIPTRIRSLLIGSIVYFVIPFDAIPDIILGTGYTDDATIILSALSVARMYVGDEEREKAKAETSRLIGT